MKNSFSYYLNEANARMDGYLEDSYQKSQGYFEIYPFTTENILGYIEAFRLKDRSLLTVGSSADQVINASMFGCFDISVYDICPFSKYYFYLKKAGILCLSYQEFLDYFCYKDYPVVFQDNPKFFNFHSYEKLRQVLRLLDYESYLFWEDLFFQYGKRKLRIRLFQLEEPRLNQLKRCNLYLSSELAFEEARESLRKVSPKFMVGDIFQEENLGIYDTIFLSNLATISHVKSREYYRMFIDRMVCHLSSDGEMLMMYLYLTDENSKYQADWKPIYDIEKTKEVFSSYITEFKSFQGASDDQKKDSVLIYRKRK